MGSVIRILFFTFLLSVFSNLSAQDLTLSGKVVNTRNEPLAGATIKIDGRQVLANIEGRFYVPVAAGKKYLLTVSSAGYETKEVTDIEGRLNGENYIEVVMEESIKSNLREVVIKTSSRRQENTASLLAFQKNNSAMSSGIAADFIRRTPDRNTGEALKRVSGASIQDGRFVIIRGLSDRYNAAFINNAQLPSTEPDKKAFSFDVIPSSLIDNIIINKSATPDLPGEFAGGLVQINTKDVPSRNLLSVVVGIGLNTNSVFREFRSSERGSTDWLGFDNGKRALPGNFPQNAQTYRAATLADQLEWSGLFNGDVYAERSSTALPTQFYSITWANNKHFQNGAVLGTVVSVQYRNSMLTYDVDRKLHQQDGEEMVSLSDNQNKFSVNAGAIANITYVRGKHKVSFKNLFNQLFESSYYTRRGFNNDRVQELFFLSSILNQRSLYSGQLEGEHQLSRTGIKLKWNGNFYFNAKSQPDLRTLSYNRPKNTSGAFEYNDDDTRRFFSDLKDYGYGANGSLSIPFQGGKTRQNFRTGASTLIRVRDFRSRIFQYTPASPTDFDRDKAFLPFDKIFNRENISSSGFRINEFTNNQDKYFGVSILNGMFGMFDNRVGITRIVWGVRVENFQQFLATRDVTSKRVNVKTENWDLLPSLNVTLALNSRNAIRFSGSRTVARPEFREIAPFSFYDYEVNYAVNGNPELARTSIFNVDARYEFYPKGGEAISLGLFYKDFSDPIELRLDPSSVLDRRNYGYANAEKAYTAGIELEVRKNLSFLHTGLTAFNLFSNLTYIHSQVTLQGSTTTRRPLQGQSPYLVNIGLQYNSEKGGWSGSALYNRMGQRLALVGNQDFPDIYERPRDQVDIQVARKILGEKGEIKLTWADLLNCPNYFYENVDSKKAFRDGSDRLFYSYSPGSTITISFTYDFNIGKNK